MINTALDVVEYVLKSQGEPQSPYWLASQMEEMRLWRASEQKVRAALEKSIMGLGERSPFVKTADNEYGLRSWTDVCKQEPPKPD